MDILKIPTKIYHIKNDRISGRLECSEKINIKKTDGYNLLITRSGIGKNLI